jgi:DNA polymerase III delta prime subunit
MATQTIWTEKYRPDTLDGYVFSNAQQQAQIEKWINEKQINHILLEGPTGTGKCLGPNELIRIRIDVDSLTIEQKNLLFSNNSI